jgi:hypothetical protein
MNTFVRHLQYLSHTLKPAMQWIFLSCEQRRINIRCIMAADILYLREITHHLMYRNLIFSYSIPSASWTNFACARISLQFVHVGNRAHRRLNGNYPRIHLWTQLAELVTLAKGIWKLNWRHYLAICRGPTQNTGRQEKWSLLYFVKI